MSTEQGCNADGAAEEARMAEASGPRLSARTRILQAAAELFYREGIRAVGIDAVIERAGVAKMSLYRTFPSKDELVAAFLSDQDRRYWQWFDQVLGRHPGNPRQQILALFGALAKFTAGRGFRGCPFNNTLVEFPHPQHPGRQVALDHNLELRRRLGLLTAGLGCREPEALADHLFLIMAGAYGSGACLGPDGPAAAAQSAAHRLLGQAMAD